MYKGQMVFAQVMDLVPWRRFQTCVDRYHGDVKTHALSTREFFKIMAFAQITSRESLNETILCLNAVPAHLYHLGLPHQLVRSNVAHANHRRDWKIFYDFAKILITEARTLYQTTPLDFNFDACVYALDSTTIDLCLSMFPWAHFRSTKSAVKMHTVINLQGKIPDFILISTGKTHDVQVMDVIEWEPGSWYAMDRGYLDFERLYRIHQCGAFFVTRSKTNTKYERVYSSAVDKSKGVMCDQRVRLTGTNAPQDYPEMIRRVRFIDKETGKSLTFLTNNMLVPAETVALLYKNRWHVELFFKWIKQHLRVKRFFGQSENAVKSQLWIAVCVYALIAMLKAKFSLSQSYYEILQILSVTVFEKTLVFSLFSGENYTIEQLQCHNQLLLFDL
jgi:hypothetical protein